MNYSREQIEQNRLLALERKKQAQLRNKLANATIVQKSPLSVTNNSLLNDNKSPNSHKPFGSGGKRYNDFKQRFQYNSNKGNTSAQQNRNSSYGSPSHHKDNTKFNKEKERFNPIQSQQFFGQKSRITGKCYMMNDERFVLETSSYFPPLTEVLKTVPSRSYDMKTKAWNFNLKDYENLMEKIIQFKSDLQIIGLPNVIVQLFRKNKTSDQTDTNIDLSRIDSVLVENLMPFQHEGICYGILKEGRCLIADDMGLGKTIQALGIAHYFKNDWPLLILTPSSVRYQWSEAIYTFLPSVPTLYVQQYLSSKDYLDNSKIVITSYDLLVRSIDTFERRSFGFVIVDESHALKSAKTARFKAVQRIVAHSRHVVLLSGTPALSRPVELYSQVSLIMPNFMGYIDYGIRYCAGEKNSYGWDFTGSSNLQELQLLLKHTCVIRRLKNDVLNQLPNKHREVIILDQDLVKAGTKEMVAMAKKFEQKISNGSERHAVLLQYYNETSLAKQKAICDYVSKLFKEKEKCLIFAHHKNVLDAICNLADSMDIKFIRIDGKTNPERRKYEIDKFQTCSQYLAAVLSITAANAGITLTAARLVIFAELFWNPGILCQAEDRVHRIGQDKNVYIRYLIAQHTADDHLWSLIQRKMNVLNEAGLDQDFSLKDLSVTNYALEGKQKTLDYFINEESQHNTEQDTVENNENFMENVASGNCSGLSTDEQKELLDIETEVFNFVEWDDTQ